MRLRPTLAVARKDALDLVLNKSTLAVLLVPILVAILFALLGSALTGKTARLLIYNPGGSPIAQVLRNAFPGAEITAAQSAQEVQAAFAPNANPDFTAGLVVPPDFEASLRAGEQPRLALYVNGADVSDEQRQLLERALSDYSRSVLSPASPVQITTASVNPPGSSGGSLFGSGFSAFYAMLSLMTSLVIGTSLMPNLLVEEKETQTLRMLLVSPASLADIVAGKLLVGLAYQFLLGLVALAVLRAFMGQVPLVLLLLLVGSCLGIALGLLVGSIFKSVSAGGAFTGAVALVYFFPALFVGPIGQYFQDNTITQAMQALPTYYLASGLLAALQGQATPATALLDLGVVLLTTAALFIAAVWILWRQARVLAHV